MKQYIRLLEHLGPYKLRLFFAAICTAMASAGTVVLPWIIKDLVDQVLSEKDAEKLTYIALSVVVIFFLLLETANEGRTLQLIVKLYEDKLSAAIATLFFT